MNKEIKIKLIDENSLKFKLLEKGEIGDIINLNSLNNVDFSSLIEKIKLLKQSEIKNIVDDKLNQQRKELDLNYQKSIVDLNKNYNAKIANLEKEKNYLELNSDAEINKKVTEIENDLKAKINQKENQIREETFKISTEKNKEINDLKFKLKNFDDKLKQQIKELDLNYQKSIVELNKNYNSKITNLEKDKSNLELKFNGNVIKKVAEFEDNLKKEINQKEKQIREEAFKISAEKNKEINDLKFKLENYEKKSQLALKEEIFEIKKLNDKSIKKLEKEKEELSSEIDNLRRNKSQNIKLIGNDLENWIDDQLQQNFAWNERITIKKEPKPINGQKPDFMITIKNGLIETKIVIEAKTELLIGENKKTNRSHLEKLENYRKNSKSKYAILVSELENEKDFLIYKDSDYKDIFIVRPFVLISLLQFMINLLTVNQKVLALDLEFEDKLKIKQDWDNFLEDVNKTFLNIRNNVENILDQKGKLISIAEKIGKSANTILDSQLLTLERKLKKFSIEKKIINKIGQLENIEELNNNFTKTEQQVEKQEKIQF